MPDPSCAQPPLWQAFSACPLCASAAVQLLRRDSCNAHPLWQPGLPEALQWMHCQACEHVYSHDFFTPAGLALLFGRANPGQLSGADLDRERARWAPSVEAVLRHLPEPPWLTGAAVWLDVGCGSGGLVMTADEYGFQALGLDSRDEAVQRITALGYQAVQGDLSELAVSEPVQVISLADVLEHVPYPRLALQKVHAALQERGLLMLSCPNLDSASWRSMTAAGTNPYWGEIEHHHNFSRASLMRLLVEEGFMPLNYSISTRYRACMEIIARKA